MDPEDPFFLIHRDLGHLGHVAAERKVVIPPAAGVKGLPPAGLVGDQGEDPPGRSGARWARRMPAGPSRLPGKFIHEAFHGEGVMGAADGAPGADRDGEVQADIFYPQVGDLVRQINDPFHGGRIDTLLHHLGEDPGEDGRDDHPVRPGRDFAPGIQCPRDPAAVPWAEKIMVDILFPGPNDLHRLGDRLGNLDRLLHYVRFSPPSEASAQVGGVDLDLFGSRPDSSAAVC